MTTGESIGVQMSRLRKRSGLSLRDLADRMGKPKHTSIQRFFEPGYKENGTLPVKDAVEFAAALSGLGEPPITPEEVFNLTGLPQVSSATTQAPQPLSAEATSLIAEFAGRIALQGQEPDADVVAALAAMLRELSLLYLADAAAFDDPAELRGVLRILTRQLGSQEP